MSNHYVLYITLRLRQVIVVSLKNIIILTLRLTLFAAVACQL